MSPDPDAADRIGAEAYEALYLYSPDGVLFTIPDGRVIAASPAAREILQMPEDQICALGRFGLADRSDERWAPLVAERDLNGFAHGVARMIRGDGHAIEVEMSARVFRDTNGEPRTCTIIRDVTERVEMERQMVDMAAELRDLAVQDDLTGLRNRRGFVEMATQVLELADRQGVACHLLFLDVDNMKELNDRFGHAAGDAGLKVVASTLKGLLRRADLVARLGGDEFVALTVGLDEEQRADIGARVRERLASQRTSLQVGRPVEVSVGWARHDPESPSGIEDMFVEADRHMYRDKAAKREAAAPPQVGE